ncbi:MAG: DUF5602 domain-containing protein [Nocardiaceae bacterium]|nr:DUF5602 domain-containing protein [Nocardiaceae bacterium]
MTRIPLRSGVAVFAAITALTVPLAACSSSEAGTSETFYGDSLSLGKGTVRTYVTNGADGKPTEVGFAFDAAALEGLPSPPHDAVAGPPPPSQPLYFPKEARGLALDHATFDYVPGGHPPPGVFDANHFDVHFYYIPQDVVKQIDPSNPNFMSLGEKLPAAKYMPQDFGPIPNSPPDEIVIPGMGQHLIDTTVPLVPGKYTFNEILINGSWDGQFAFVEPMVTLNYLQTKPDVTKDLKLPEAYQKTGLYPTKYSITFDEATKTYKVSLTGLVERTKS